MAAQGGCVRSVTAVVTGCTHVGVQHGLCMVCIDVTARHGMLEACDPAPAGEVAT